MLSSGAHTPAPCTLLALPGISAAPATKPPMSPGSRTEPVSLDLTGLFIQLTLLSTSCVPGSRHCWDTAVTKAELVVGEFTVSQWDCPTELLQRSLWLSCGEGCTLDSRGSGGPGEDDGIRLGERHGSPEQGRGCGGGK